MKYISLDEAVYRVCRQLQDKEAVTKLLSPEDRILFQWAIV
jgi:hypothetical protein